MKLGLQINSFTWPGGPEAMGPTLASIVRTADDVGFDSIWVMDHFFQIRSIGRIEEPMLEGWTTLGFMAAHSTRARLGLMVGGVHYRYPGLWVKAATTLDVLSGGRAWLGIGAAWNEDESRSLGFPFPPLGERFEMLEETLAIAHGMWQGERGSEEEFRGRAFHATRLLNSPQSLSRPRVPIMIGGGGEKKTLRLVARYADATNVFGTPEGDRPQVRDPRRALRGHRPRPRRDRTLDPPGHPHLQGWRRQHRDARARSSTGCGDFSDAGAQHVIVSMRQLPDLAALELVGSEVIPQIRALP